jgi:hypothetical protein
MNSFDHGSDVAVLENPTSAVSSLDGDVHHGTCQVVGTNHLVRKQQLKCGLDGTQKAIAEIRFLPRLHRIDICGPEEVNARESGRDECVLGLSLVSRESDPASSGRIRIQGRSAHPNFGEPPKITERVISNK